MAPYPLIKDELRPGPKKVVSISLMDMGWMKEYPFSGW
jgi:hypothetical protein